MRPAKFIVAGFVLLGVTTAIVIAATQSGEPSRTWSSKSGKFKIKAEFEGMEDGSVQLKREDGTIVKVPLEKLSVADNRWIKNRMRNKPSFNPDQNTSTDMVSTDWPRWRGPKNDGVSSETGLLQQWPDEGPPLLWSARGFGDGFSSVSIFNGKIYTMGREQNQTKLLCASIEDGSRIWEANVGGGDKPNCTPTVDPESNLVFGISHKGDMVCANADTGEEVWRKNFADDFGGRMMSGWGYSESPLVDGDLLICTPGGDRAVMAALEKQTGRVVWTTPMQGGSAGYSSIVISNGAGVKQYITLVGKGLISVAAADGRPLWHYPRISNTTANVPTPIVKDDLVFGSSGYGDGGTAMLRLSKSGNSVRFQEVYYHPNKTLQNHHGGMVLIGDFVYMGHGHNEGKPVCINIRTGKPAWGPVRGPGSNSAAIVAADRHLYFRYENAIMGLIEATPTGYNLKGSFRIKSNNGKSWAHPVIADKKLYLRDQHELHCYDIAQK